MGIESDQVVYEYLSRVGDIAQQQQLSSGTRMRLVSELRNEIDRRRAKAPVDSPAAVRRIIDRLGSPDDVVAAAADSGTGVPPTPTPSVPVQRADEQPAQPPPGPQPKKGFRKVVPRPRPSSPPPADPAPAGEGPGVEQELPDWWRREPEPFGPGTDVPGFTGGIEIPDMLRKPGPKPPEEPEKEDEPEPEEAVPEAEAQAAPRRRRIPFLRAAKTGGGGESGGGRSWSNPLLLLAAAALLAGAVLGNLLALVVGWVVAYASRRLSERETKTVVFWLPGSAAAAGLVWLWGRSEGRWGDPIAEGHMNDALADTWPWVLRGAAVASALFLVWRSQRQK
ncbi:MULTISPECIES: hypothetical protein [Streptomyces]|uniref:Integral membrane protein n=2 Tax=Streptomyces TaxID=1883 RepID=A0ABV9J3L1_9ACTN